MDSQSSISIWFFVGIALLVNGLLILAAGLYQFAHPPQNPVVLYHLHANVWWGALLFLLGAFYCRHFSPARKSKR